MMAKSALIVAALALLGTTCVASAFTREQSNVIAVATLAQWTGLDNHCPRFKLMESEMIAELSSTGLTQHDFDSSEMLAERDRAIYPIVLSYAANPSRVCNAAWLQLGPKGSYRRQMLEVK